MDQPADVARQVSDALERNPGTMTSQLARELGVPEAEVVRALPNGRSVELDTGRWQEIIGSFEDLGQVHVIVSNGATTLEAQGAFGGFSIWGDFFNVQTPSLDMHVRWPELGAAFAVEKRSHMNDEVTTLSMQFFDKAGHSAFKVFLNFGGKPSEARRRQFDGLRSRFALEAAAPR
jgi:putative hemin transport protein